MDCVYLPVSLGESIDKLTILDIKLQKIQDKRRIDVQREYDLLYSLLEPHVTKYPDLYRTMKQVNLLIWDMMDLLRDGSLEETEYLRVCKECIEYNDIRFRVKNKFNYVSNSTLKEQKSYRVNRLVIEICDEIAADDFIRPIRYCSFIYDEIVIVSNSKYLKQEFGYDPTILFADKFDGNEFKKRIAFQKSEECDQTKIYETFGLDEQSVELLTQ